MNKVSSSNNRGASWVVAQICLMLLCAGSGLRWSGGWTIGGHDWIVAAALTLAGAFFGIAGVGVLGKNRTIFPEPQPNSDLIRKGIYRHVRHPLYSSVIFLAFGWACWRHSLAAFGAAVVLTLFLVLKSINEESRLRKRFPDYEAYRRTTRRFIPWLF